jgi:hypothetical protein
LVGIRESFDSARVSRFHDEGYLKPYKRNVVDIFVTKDAVQHALDTANELFLALQDRGHRVVLAPADRKYSRASLVCGEGEKAREHDYSDGSWRGPARPTLLFIGSVAFGLTLFEISEEVEVRYDQTLSAYVRVSPTTAKRALPREHGEWISRRRMPSGRLGLHAYSPERAVRWDKYWYEQPERKLPVGAIARELEGMGPLMLELKAEAERKAEEERKKWEAQQLEAGRKAAEQRRIEEEKQRYEELELEIGDWRFAHDIRALVEELKKMVTDHGLRLTAGGTVEDWMNWMLKQADDADPLSDLRRDADAMMKEHRIALRRPKPLGAIFARSRRRHQR